MSVGMAFGDEDDFRLENEVSGQKPGGKKRRGRAAHPANGEVERQMTFFESVKSSESIQGLLEMLAKIWAKILELEQRIIASFERLAGVEEELQKQPFTKKEWYTTKDLAKIYGLEPATFTKYFTDKKLKGEKTMGGRGETGEWRMSEAERQRYDREGLRRDETKPRRKPPRRMN